MINWSGARHVPRPISVLAPIGLGSPRGDMPHVNRVLIADDHPLVRDGLRTIIAVSFDDCQIEEAASIGEAIEAIERNCEFDLVLLDLHLPDANGFQGLIRLREQFPSVPVVIVSGAVEWPTVRAAVDSGASGFIPKSLRRSAIVDAMKTILSGEIFVPEEYRIDEDSETEEAAILRRIDTLTPQQKVVLGLVVAGKLNKQIAYELDISMTTVKAHVSAILTKLNVYSRTQAVILANKIGFPPYICTRH